MANYTKIEKRRQHVIEAMERNDAPRTAVPLCHCGAAAQYEINRIDRVVYVCAEHLPPDGMG